MTSSTSPSCYEAIAQQFDTGAPRPKPQPQPETASAPKAAAPPAPQATPAAASAGTTCFEAIAQQFDTGAPKPKPKPEPQQPEATSAPAAAPPVYDFRPQAPRAADVEDLGRGSSCEAAGCTSCSDEKAGDNPYTGASLDDVESKIAEAKAQLTRLHEAKARVQQESAKLEAEEKALVQLLKTPRGAVVPQKVQAMDGCTATAHVAYAMSESAFIFPITPSSPMAEICEVWAVQGVKNIFGSRLNVQQLQSEAGAAGALHGSVTSGGLGTTFTASQGLLLMIPNMYKIAGELLPCVIHVSARALAGQGLSIFGDHQDVMACRSCGWGMLASQSVQDCHDLGLVAHVATLKARVPILHFHDGFRTSHEINTIETMNQEQIQALMDFDALRKHRKEGLSPLRPVMRGSNQNPDVYMQAVEGANKYYMALPGFVEEVMKEVSAVTGRPLSPVRYTGHPDPEHIVVQMGSAVKVTEAVVSHFQLAGARVGVVSPLLYRPWPTEKILEVIPPTVKTVTVLDRTKEHGSYREPLFLDIAATLQGDPRYAHVTVLGGRYGLGSKEYTPSMAVTVFENAIGRKKDRFTVGIEDDVTFTNLPLPLSWQMDSCVPEGTAQCVFYGLAGDGTVGANKSAVKIIGDNSKLKGQAYFSYTSVKSGTPTISHMRFGPEGFEAPYLTLQANYVACSFTEFVNCLDMLHNLKSGGTFVLNCPWTTLEEVEARLPTFMKKQLAEKAINFYTIDASRVAQESGLGKLTNNVMQTAFFNLSKVLPVEQAIEYFKKSIKKMYQKHGDAVVNKNIKAVDNSIEHLTQISFPAEAWAALPAEDLPAVAKYQGISQFVEQVQGPMTMLRGDEVPVSALPVGGVTPLGGTSHDKKAVSPDVVDVDMDKCTQCNYCSFVCPHGVIRPFLLDQNTMDSAPASLVAKKAVSSEQAGHYYRIQVSAKDCTGCKVCVKTCPSDALRMVTQDEARELKHEEHWNFLRALPVKEDLMKVESVKGSQMQQPLLEFSAACSGCGETPYVKLLTQMFGDRMVVANATGCSSIWGNPYGSTPYQTRDSTGKGPAWQNSLFEDNAEFGFGMAHAAQARRQHMRNCIVELLKTSEIDNVPQLRGRLNQWVEKWKSAGTCTKLQEVLPGLLEKAKEEGASSFEFQQVYDNRECFVKTSQWIVGGDGWAYDIGFGGLDHVVASGTNVNILVLDTEAYSNTGGQRSKSTPAGAIAKFATTGKDRQKKNLGEICMSYGSVFVASIAMGSSMTQTVKALAQAEEYDGPSIILAYAPCIEFKIMHKDGLGEMINCQKLAVSSGYWPLYRFDPRKETPMQLDHKSIKDDLSEYLLGQNRFNGMRRTNPDHFKQLTDTMRTEIRRRHKRYLAQSSTVSGDGEMLSILYGSETGNTAELAARFAGNCQSRGYAVELAELNDLSVEDLASRKSVVIMISTCGEGAIPQNAKTLYEELCRAEPGVLSGVTFSVFALGDRSYRHFCSAGKDYARQLKALGAAQRVDLGIGDDKDEDKFETGWAKWMPEWVKEVGAPEDPKESEPPAPLFQLEPASAKDAMENLARPPRTQPLQMTLNTRISPPDYPYSIRHIKFADPESRLPYMLGDALAVHWKNDEARVKAFLQAYGLDGDECYTATPLEGAAAGAKAERLEGAFKVSSVFTEMLDIFGRPSKNFLKELSKVAPAGADRERLSWLVSEAGQEAYTKEITGEGLNFADVLLKFPTAKPTFSQLLTMIPVIKPRLYTIASSTRNTPGLIELTVITNTWMTNRGVELTGSCTDYLERHDQNKVSGAVWMDCSISPGSFEFGEPDVPMVMTGTGTGVAPFLAFARERDWYVRNHGSERAGQMWLFFGCRNRRSDYILGEELEDLSQRGVLTHLRPAFSRDGPKKVYIQNKIEEEAVGVYQALVEKKGYLYLCGQAGDREKDVLNAVTKAFEIGGRLSPEKAQQLLDELMEEGRYCPELY